MNVTDISATDPASHVPVAAPDPDPQNTRTGRPPVLGTNQRKRLVALINAGCSRRAAARRIGCSPATLETIRREITPEQRRAVIERLGDLLCQLEESPRRK